MKKIRFLCPACVMEIEAAGLSSRVDGYTPDKNRRCEFCDRRGSVAPYAVGSGETSRLTLQFLCPTCVRKANRGGISIPVESSEVESNRRCDICSSRKSIALYAVGTGDLLKPKKGARRAKAL